MKSFKYKSILATLVCFLIIDFHSFAHNSDNTDRITRLEEQIAQMPASTAKVDLMIDLFDLYFNSTKEKKDENKDKIIALGENTLALADKLGYRKGQILTYKNLSDMYKYYRILKLYGKYQIKYTQYKGELDDIQAAEIEAIKKEQAKKAAEIAELEKDKDLNKELIEQKKAELNATKDKLNTSMSKIKERDYLIREKETVISEKDNVISENEDQIRLAHDSIIEQNRINQNLMYQKQILEDEKKIIQLSEKAAKSRNWMFFLMGAIAVIITLFMGILLISMRRNQAKLKEKNDVIKLEKERSEKLLLNILPEDMAKELKVNGFAKAQSFENVTVFFSDFKDFTKISEQLSPSELVTEIDICFKAFDQIIEKYNIEKIKTVGDAYICVAGLDKTKQHNPIEMINAAIEIRNFVADRIENMRKAKKVFFEVRIGIHTGPIVAGIVGFKKFAYDIWGDTVNTAARMEEASLPGKINVSAFTFELVKEHFTFTYRGKIQAKNKGEIDMYFIHEAINVDSTPIEA